MSPLPNHILDPHRETALCSELSRGSEQVSLPNLWQEAKNCEQFKVPRRGEAHHGQGAPLRVRPVWVQKLEEVQPEKARETETRGGARDHVLFLWEELLRVYWSRTTLQFQTYSGEIRKWVCKVRLKNVCIYSQVQIVWVTVKFCTFSHLQ